jgi:cellulose synthase/poly-beta-1,6-N-acetylglucosamine synthase-like glycosyltransferase
LKQTYPNFNIIFVDDGSKDNTFKLVSEAFQNHPKLKIFTKVNGGKATALNFGISKSDAEYVVCIDADTKLEQNAVNYLIANFSMQNQKIICSSSRECKSRKPSKLAHQMAIYRIHYQSEF